MKIDKFETIFESLQTQVDNPLFPLSDDFESDVEKLRARCKELGIQVLPTGHVRPKGAGRILGSSEKTLANQRSKGGDTAIPFYKCPYSGLIYYDIKDLVRVRQKKFTSATKARLKFRGDQ